MKTVEGFDPFDVNEGPRHHQRMAELRAACPMAQLDSGMVVLPRYDDVKETLIDPTMSNSNSARAPGVDVPPEDKMFFFEYDPPLHPALRGVVRQLLSRRQANQRTEQIRALILELLDPILKAGAGDVVEELTGPLTSRLMMRITGYPEEDAHLWREWVKDWIQSGFSFTNRNERGTGYAECYPEIFEYVDRHIDERAAAVAAGADCPDDALTCVVEASIDGEPLPRNLMRMIVMSLPPAGGNTMGNFVNNTLHSLAENPSIFARLRADRSLVPVAVEESLRRDSPSMFISRVCREATTVVGEDLEAGQKVLLGLASANRDETAFPDPEEFSLDRTTQPPHVAFGWGNHTCVGAHIVRHLGATLLDTLLDTVDAIEIEPGTTPAPYISPQGNGFSSLRLRFTPAAAQPV